MLQIIGKFANLSVNFFDYIKEPRAARFWDGFGCCDEIFRKNFTKFCHRHKAKYREMGLMAAKARATF